MLDRVPSPKEHPLWLLVQDLLQARCPSCHPTNSVKALKEYSSCCRLRTAQTPRPRVNWHWNSAFISYHNCSKKHNEIAAKTFGTPDVRVVVMPVADVEDDVVAARRLTGDEQVERQTECLSEQQHTLTDNGRLRLHCRRDATTTLLNRPRRTRIRRRNKEKKEKKRKNKNKNKKRKRRSTRQTNNSTLVQNDSEPVIRSSSGTQQVQRVNKLLTVLRRQRPESSVTGVVLRNHRRVTRHVFAALVPRARRRRNHPHAVLLVIQHLKQNLYDHLGLLKPIRIHAAQQQCRPINYLYTWTFQFYSLGNAAVSIIHLHKFQLSPLGIRKRWPESVQNE